MLGIIIVLSIVCVLLITMVSVQDNRNTKLTAENGLMKGRLESAQEKLASRTFVEEEPLTEDAIAESIRYVGCVPSIEGNFIRFMKDGEKYYIDLNRLPVFFMMRCYMVEVNDWQMDLLRHAAHVMSDQRMIVKALVEGEGNDTSIRIFVVSLDRNYDSLKENLPRYITMLEQAYEKLKVIYDQLAEERREAAQTINPLYPMGQTENKILS